MYCRAERERRFAYSATSNGCRHIRAVVYLDVQDSRKLDPDMDNEITVAKIDRGPDFEPLVVYAEEVHAGGVMTTPIAASYSVLFIGSRE